MSVTVGLAARIAPAASGARLVCPGVGTLLLPWWPDEIEHGGLAPSYVDNERPGRTPAVSRGSEPLQTRRITFSLSGTSPNDPIDGWVATITKLAKAKPVVQLILGSTDGGRWMITDAGITVHDWTDDGRASDADVVISLREPSDAAAPIGPVRAKSKKATR